MKKFPTFSSRVYVMLCLVYLVLSLAASVFYINAGFWTYLTRWCGRVWLCLTLILCMVRILHRIHPHRSFKICSTLCIALISCIQVPAVGAWLALSDGRSTYFLNSSATLITPRGALFHAAILLMGLALLYHDAKPLPNIEQP